RASETLTLALDFHRSARAVVLPGRHAGARANSVVARLAVEIGAEPLVRHAECAILCARRSMHASLAPEGLHDTAFVVFGTGERKKGRRGELHALVSQHFGRRVIVRRVL